MSLTGKSALVTGATRGIGQAIALELGKRGAKVFGTATSEAGAASIREMLQAQRIAGDGLVMNVCDENSIHALSEHLKKEDNLPDILINNVGITQDNLFLRMSQEQWSSVINTNLNSLYSITKVFLKSMLKMRWGRIINITSVVGVSGNPGQSNYCAAKAGMIGFTKSLAQEIAVRGITVNCVAPGFIDTDMTRNLTVEQKQAIEAKIPTQRMGKPEEIASAVVYLASEEAGYITGQTLHVNGGMYMV